MNNKENQDMITTKIEGTDFTYNRDTHYEKDGHIYCKTCKKEKIYDLAISGYGVQAIRRILFYEKIPTPTWWNRKKGLRNKTKKSEQTVKDDEYWWDCTTIKEIIENPVYLGHTASQKANYQFKIGWLSDKSKDDWIVVENTHEPIVSEDTYKMPNLKAEKDLLRQEKKVFLQDLLNALIVRKP